MNGKEDKTWIFDIEEQARIMKSYSTNKIKQALAVCVQKRACSEWSEGKKTSGLTMIFDDDKTKCILKLFFFENSQHANFN